SDVPPGRQPRSRLFLEHVQGVLQISRKRRHDADPLSGARMQEPERTGMQPLPGQTEPTTEDRVSAIERIATARVPDCRHVYADLMRIAGLSMDVEQGRCPVGLTSLVM